MTEKIYLHLLLFCAIMWQGIFATFYNEDNKLSSDSLVRKRRVINHLPGTHAMRIESANYIVKIKEDRRFNCAGAILSHYTVITAGSCISGNLSKYKILSGGAYDQLSNSHNVTSSAKYNGSPPHQTIDGIALVTVDPLFVYGPKTGSIHLHLTPLPAGTSACVSGWGRYCPFQPAAYPKPKLISMYLPIMNHEECKNIYISNANRANIHNAITITEKHICTHDLQQYCARGDAGAPLVVNHLLAGIHTWKGEYPDQINPDVYINLQRPDYIHWIRENTLLM